MTTRFIIILIPFMLLRMQPIKAQSEEIQQLILNIEKLNQLRAILQNMYKGYTILSKGYNTIKDLAEGNFSLHKTFLDGLLEVSPTVRKYKRVAEIILIQKQLVKEYKSAFSGFRSIGVFKNKDLDYLEQVYRNLIDRSLKDIEELIMVVTAGQLRMNDAERLNAIDKIHTDVSDKLQFLRYFNDKTSLIAAQKKRALIEIDDLSTHYGIK